MSDPMEAVFERSIALATTWEECRTRLEISYGAEMIPRLEKMARATKYSQWFAEGDAKKLNELKSFDPSRSWRNHFLDFLKFHLKNSDEVLNVLDGLFVDACGGADGLPSPLVSSHRTFTVDSIPGRIDVLGSSPEAHFERGFARWVRENFSGDGQLEPDVKVKVNAKSNCLLIEVHATVQLF